MSFDIEKLEGKIFEDLIVLKRASINDIKKYVKRKIIYLSKPYYWCKCKCGNKCVVYYKDLINKHIKSCGCKVHPDITNKKYGKLTVIRKATKEEKTNNTNRHDRSQLWLCRCECGKKVITSKRNLESGNTLSCGDKKHRLEKLKDLSGQKFGKLTAIKKVYKKKGNQMSAYYECLCDCGNKTLVCGSHLIEGAVKSCGCVNSHGEEKVLKLLRKNNIPFIYQYHIKNKDGKRKLSFDFFVDNKYIIEIDGLQHFRYNDIGWMTKEKFERTRSCDIQKNNYCFNNNITLLRIPYKERNLNITIEDLMINSKYVVNKNNINKYWKGEINYDKS